MTEKTVILGIRLNKGDKEKLSKYITRESLESILRQIERGEIEIRSKGVVIPSVNTISKSVNTSDCDNCPYIGEEDRDGEWVRDMAHELNIDKEVFKKKVEQGMR